MDWTHKSITFKLEHNIPRLEPIHPHFYSIPTALLFGSTEKLFSALEVPCDVFHMILLIISSSATDIRAVNMVRRSDLENQTTYKLIEMMRLKQVVHM